MESETVCIANIGPRERRKRLVFGAVFRSNGQGQWSDIVSVTVK